MKSLFSILFNKFKHKFLLSNLNSLTLFFSPNSVIKIFPFSFKKIQLNSLLIPKFMEFIIFRFLISIKYILIYPAVIKKSFSIILRERIHLLIFKFIDSIEELKKSKKYIFLKSEYAQINLLYLIDSSIASNCIIISLIFSLDNKFISLNLLKE